MTREEKLQKAHQMFDNRNLITELNWQREYFRRGYISKQEELFNLWIFDECIKALEQETVSKEVYDHEYYLRNEFEIKIARLEHDKNEVLDKIRAEMEKETDRDNHADEYCDGYYDGMRNALAIIDKYKGESDKA